jgi:hypothetical protein
MTPRAKGGADRLAPPAGHSAWWRPTPVVSSRVRDGVSGRHADCGASAFRRLMWFLSPPRPGRLELRWVLRVATTRAETPATAISDMAQIVDGNSCEAASVKLDKALAEGDESIFGFLERRYRRHPPRCENRVAVPHARAPPACSVRARSSCPSTPRHRGRTEGPNGGSAREKCPHAGGRVGRRNR